MSNSGQNNLPVQSHGRLGTYIPPKHSGPERKKRLHDFTEGQVSAENREFEKLLKDSLMVVESLVSWFSNFWTLPL